MSEFIIHILDYIFTFVSICLTGAYTWTFNQINNLNIKNAVIESEIKNININLIRMEENIEKIANSISQKEDVELMKQLLIHLKDPVKKRY